MQSKRRLILFVTAFTVVFGFLTIADPLFAASTEQALYSFCSTYNCDDGFAPYGGLIFDQAGNLYGMTELGGAHGRGTVFELTPGTNGTWSETVLYNFCSASGCTDGADPFDGSLIFDAAGKMYGTTYQGGASRKACGGYGCGTVFELTPGGNGKWKETVLHSFGRGKDGKEPYAGLIFDAAGNLYSTTGLGGAHGRGTVFELTPGGNGKWKETVLHSFTGTDGANPYAGLIFDDAGNLYGTTNVGGTHSTGTVFELSPSGNGKWKETVLHNFRHSRNDGCDPGAGLIFDGAGNLYSTTTGCGAYKNGTVFELTPGGNSTWTETVLYNFCSASGCTDGGAPAYGGLIFDAAGNLYGTTLGGGANGYGTVFELTPGANGQWAEIVPYSFCSVSGCTDGKEPYGGLIFDAAENLYGMTAEGGANGYGTVFEITP